MTTIVIAHRPGSKLSGLPLNALQEELEGLGAEVKPVNINKISSGLRGDLVYLYNSSYRVHKNRLDRVNIPVFNVPAAYGKEKQYKILSGAGIKIAKYEIVDKNSNLEKVISKLGLPMITKPIVGTGGKGVRLHMDERSLRRSLGHNKVIAQKYIKEAVAGDVRALVIEGEVVASLKRTPRRGSVASNFHAGGSPSIYNITEEECEAAVSAAKAMGLTISGVDIVPTVKGPIVLEANSVPDLMHIREVAGVNAIPEYAQAIFRAANA